MNPDTNEITMKDLLTIIKAVLKMKEFLLWQAPEVNVVIFQLRRNNYSQDDAMPIYFPGSKKSISGFLNDASFVSGYILEGV